MSLKHFDNRGFELCSGRDGWAKRKTDEVAQVTCKNCLRVLRTTGVMQLDRETGATVLVKLPEVQS